MAVEKLFQCRTSPVCWWFRQGLADYWESLLRTVCSQPHSITSRSLLSGYLHLIHLPLIVVKYKQHEITTRLGWCPGQGHWWRLHCCTATLTTQHRTIVTCTAWNCPCEMTPPAPGTTSSTICLCVYCLRHLTDMESHSVCLFVPGFFHLASCLRSLPGRHSTRCFSLC